MEASDYIYENNADNTARFVIGTKGKNPLIVMSINPSVGSPTRTSPTLGTVRHIAADYGYDSWIILCLYPQRATHLDELAEVTDPALVAQNNKVISQILHQYPGHKIWAAWGTHYHDRYYFPQLLADVVKIADECHETWMHYGPLDGDDTPRYALYLSNGEGWYPFDVHAFLEKTMY